ncbi:hypothetical protein PISMIDRAFT_116796 [Pisolithus microcarpus 441]|uniref:Uncharacterized protein n=1 Tax=Pisolithus microcarpus 441 TaxID=765257 RepID=A0A0C9XQP4_9AGAM|nr:hypothetical protein PISMIDRAFT_116796 [Pisolithus microcarpus 441]
MALDANPDDSPIPLHCLQFPVCLTYAMTIKKPQGQTVQHVGLDLRTPVFSHGQLCGSLQMYPPRNIKVLYGGQGQQTNKATNVVFNEAFRGLNI